MRILDPEELTKVETSIIPPGSGHATLDLRGPDHITTKIAGALIESETRDDV